MDNSHRSIITIGFAVFSMLFGAGNLIYPLLSGALSTSQYLVGILSFCLTAVCLPILGLIGIILFDGNYEKFFHRLSKIPGDFLIWSSLMLLGPLLVLPRIITLSHMMIAPFLPLLNTITPVNSFIFCLIFLVVTFASSYRENRIVPLLGNIISPLLLGSLGIIFMKAVFSSGTVPLNSASTFDVFKENFIRGYETLDLLSSLYFGAMILHLIRNLKSHNKADSKKAAKLALQGGIFGATLLAIVYFGMGYLGAHFGHDLVPVKGALFREIAFRVLGSQGALVIVTAVIMACLSTTIALSAIIAEFLQHKLFQKKISFTHSLIIVLIACIPLSIGGLDSILSITAGPLLYIAYPVFITVTVCNIAYKLFGFTPIKIPTLLVFLLATIRYFYFV